jgi:hypothetical protein
LKIPYCNNDFFSWNSEYLAHLFLNYRGLNQGPLNTLSLNHTINAFVLNFIYDIGSEANFDWYTCICILDNLGYSCESFKKGRLLLKLECLNTCIRDIINIKGDFLISYIWSQIHAMEFTIDDYFATCRNIKFFISCWNCL